jgi:hypothetical protein
MASRLTANNNVTLIPPDLTPDTRLRLGRLRQSSKIHKLPLVVDFGKGSTVSLSNGNKFPAIRAGPTPGRRTFPSLAAQVGMADKVVKVDIVAAECVEGVARDDFCGAVRAVDDLLAPGRLFHLRELNDPRFLWRFQVDCRCVSWLTMKGV